MERKHFKTVVVSDLHLGSLYSKVVELTRFLENLTCDTLVLAGDIIDGWQLKKIEDTAYNFLLRFNNLKNRARDKQGKEKYSFSKALKHGVKKAVNLISGFESDIAEFAKSKKCNGIICGHIHHPEDKILKNGIRYLNSGDWVESLTALGEDEDCKWKVLKYGDLVTEGVSTN